MPCPFCAGTAAAAITNTDVVCDSCGRQASTANWGRVPKRGRNTYEEGMHGAKKSEQKRLKTSGATHQSEHVVGYEVFGHGAKRGGSDFAKKIENQAPAYQEEFDAHRKHIGTGNHNNYRNSGQSSNDYREQQRRLVRNRGVGNAVQLNQLHYAFQPEFRPSDSGKQANLKKADDSFNKMVETFHPIPLWDNGSGTLTQFGPTDAEKAEMNLARMTARGGKFPTRDEEIAQMKKFGIMPSAQEKAVKISPKLPFTRDIYGIPKDGNCLFHSIWEGLNAVRPNLGFVSNQILRQQAVGFLRADPEINQIGAVNAEYLEGMQNDGAWAGELEAMAIAHTWGVRIAIQAPDYNIVYNDAAPTGFVVHYDGSGHYSVGPLGEDKA